MPARNANETGSGMPPSWRSQVTRLQQLAVESCWRPFEGEAAGDFTDLVDLGDGRFVAVLGDAPGFGPGAADFADTLRYEVRRALRDVDAPATVLEHLDRTVTEQHEDALATAVCALIDPELPSVEVASAGHLPVLLWSGEDVRFLDDRRDPPLGVISERRSSLYPLERDVALFFYTDGLVERRGQGLDLNLAALAGLARGMASGSAWASELARLATAAFGQPTDDATVLSIRVVPGAERTDPAGEATGPVELRLYLDRRDLRSAATERVVRDLVARLAGTIDVLVEVVDLAHSGERAERDAVMATPTVVRVRPLPVVRVIGGLRSSDDLARALQLPVPEETGR